MARSSLLFGTILLLVVAPAPEQARAQDGARVTLSLTATTGGFSIAGAGVRLSAMGRDEFERFETSDARGQVRFESVPGGLYQVDVLPAGFATESFTLIVPMSGEMHHTLNVGLVQELPVIDVVAERIFPTLQRRGFYQRRARGFGHLLTHDQIMATVPTRLSDVLVRIPSVNVQRAARGLFVTNLTATDVSRGGLCLFDVFVDGLLITTPEGFVDPDMVPVDDVLGIEVYHRVTHVPMEFRARGCGSILIWTGVARRE